MADLTQKEMEKLFNEAEPGDPNQSMSQEEMKELFEKKDPSIIDSFVSGVVNQGNLLPKFAGFSGAVRNDKPEDISQTDWDKLSFWEKYDILKKPYEVGAKRVREAHPVADVAGNITGGMLVPSGGGVALKAAGKLGAGAVGKATANILGNAAEGAFQSYSFSDDGNKGEAAAYGAGIGAAVPVAGKLLKGLAKGGKAAKEYYKRVPEILESRKKGTNIIEDLENTTKSNIAKTQNIAETEAIKFADDIQQESKNALEKSQILDQEIIETTRLLRKKQQDLMSEESTKGWDKLSDTKDIKVDSMLNEINSAISKLDKSSPSLPRLQKWKSRLETSKKKNLSEKELKGLTNAIWEEIKEADLADYKRGQYIPLSSRELMKIAGIGRDILVGRNKEYAEVVKDLSKKVERINKIDNDLNLGSDNFLNTLKFYKSEKKIRDSLKDFEELTGENLTGLIDKTNDIKGSALASSFKKENADLVDTLVNSEESNKNYKKLYKDLKTFDEKNGTKYADMLGEFRLKHQIDLLNRVKRYTADTGNKDLTPLVKKAYNIIPEGIDIKEDGIVSRVLNKEKISSKSKRLKKDEKARQMITDLSAFNKQNANENIRSIENEVLYDLMGTSQANGSRRVNLGANIGEAVNEWLKKLPVVGKAYGAIAGAMIDNGTAQRLRRELLEKLYTLEKNPTNVLNPKSNIPEKLGARVLAPQVSSYLDKEEKNKQAWENLRSSMVEKQMEKNEEYFGRKK